MSNRNQKEHDEAREALLQPDPMLRRGRVSGWHFWIATFAVVAVLGLVLYGLARDDEAQLSFAPENATSTGRGSANAPLTQRSGANAPLVEPGGTGR